MKPLGENGLKKLISLINSRFGKVGNFKAVSTESSQGLTNTEKANARANIGAGTSNFSGSYDDLTDKPTIPTITDTYSSSSSNGMSGKAVASAINNALSNPTIDSLAFNYYDNSSSATYTGAYLWSSTIDDSEQGAPDYYLNCDTGLAISLDEGLVFDGHNGKTYYRLSYNSAGDHGLSLQVYDKTNKKWVDVIFLGDDGWCIFESVNCNNLYISGDIPVVETRKINNKSLGNDVVLGINDIAMTGYSKPSTTSAIVTSDSLNTAIGKLEKALDNKSNSSHNHDSAYLKLSGGTMTGTIIMPANDSVGIEPATNNYGYVGSANKKFYKMYATTFYGALSGNATSATTASKLNNTSAIGSATNPVYFSANGVPVACNMSDYVKDSFTDSEPRFKSIKTLDLKIMDPDFTSEYDIADIYNDLGTLWVDGTVVRFGNDIYAPSYKNSSSLKYKENVLDMPNDVAEELLSLRPVVFDYKNGVKDCKGLIAEEAYEVDEYQVGLKDNEPDSIDYTRYIAQLIKMIQIQNDRIDKLEKIITKNEV